MVLMKSSMNLMLCCACYDSICRGQAEGTVGPQQRVKATSTVLPIRPGINGWWPANVRYVNYAASNKRQTTTMGRSAWSEGKEHNKICAQKIYSYKLYGKLTEENCKPYSLLQIVFYRLTVYINCKIIHKYNSYIRFSVTN